MTLLQVVSLSGYGGPFANCVASSVKKQIQIFDLTQPASPQYSWNMETFPEKSPTEDLVCLLKGNRDLKLLFSGSWTGSLCSWDLRSKPKEPVHKFMKHNRAITGIEVVNEYLFLSSSADSTVLLWDLRDTSNSVGTVFTDGKSVLNLKINKSDHLIAVATLKVGSCSSVLIDCFRVSMVCL